MAQWEPEQIVTQSLLERLIDRDPQANADPPPSRAQSVRLLKSSLRRDLEWLLNARRTPDAVGREFGLLEHSLYNYGVPDLTAINRESAQDRARLGRIIEQTLAAFEPRLKKVKVTQIEGLLDMDPAPELISFDTVLQLSSGEYQVKGDSGAG